MLKMSLISTKSQFLGNLISHYINIAEYRFQAEKTNKQTKANKQTKPEQDAY